LEKSSRLPYDPVACILCKSSMKLPVYYWLKIVINDSPAKK
jgi:hypothetical protein